MLFNILISIALAIFDNMTGTFDMSTGIGLVGGIYSLAVLIPGLAVGVRRLHDTGRSGWWLLLALIPIIGAIILIVYFAQDSQPESNEYGPNPKTGAVGISEHLVD